MNPKRKYLTDAEYTAMVAEIAAGLAGTVPGISGDSP